MPENDTTDSLNGQADTPPEIAPDLQAVVTAWPTLPEALKAGIVAMVKAATVPPTGGDSQKV